MDMLRIPPSVSRRWYDELGVVAASGVLNRESILESALIAKRHLCGLDELIGTLKYGRGYIEVGNLPIDQSLPSPPADGLRPKGKSFISELLLTGMTELLELHPFSFREEKDGALVHEICPVPALSGSVSSNGRVGFDFHTDGAYLPRHLRPHSLSLLCLMDAAGVGTHIAPVSEAVALLDDESIEQLMGKNFFHVSPETFKVEHQGDFSSVLDRVDGVYELKAALHSTQALAPRAQAALVALSLALKRVQRVKKWQPAELLIFSNLRCVHGRGEVRGKRWLQRCYGSYNQPTGSVISLN